MYKYLVLLALFLGIPAQADTTPSVDLRVLATVTGDHAAIAYGHSKDDAQVILEAVLDAEGEQRRFFKSVPEYRVTYALSSILESFLPLPVALGAGESRYQAFKSAVFERTKNPSLYFDLNWKTSPKSQGGIEAYRTLSRANSEWPNTILEWKALPETEAQFVEQLRAQLNEQYLSITRRRVLQELLSQQVTSCLKVAASPTMTQMRSEYEASKAEFARQSTAIVLSVISGPEAAVLAFNQVSAQAQSAALAELLRSKPKPTRGDLNQLRAQILSKLKQQIPVALKWEDHTLIYPMSDEDRSGLSVEQKDFALKAPLNQTLLPNVLEANPDGSRSIWLVSGESRLDPEQRDLADSEVYFAVEDRLKSKAYMSCAQSWMEKYKRERISFKAGVEVTEDQWRRALGRVLSVQQSEGPRS